MKDTRKRRGLRRGFTTGACATAAAQAAAQALATGLFPDPVTIRLPGGGTPSFPLSRKKLQGESATAGVVKDAGDDPDVTHGAEIVATVTRGGVGISFKAGEGVGTVTRPGLALPPGEPAINPVPRAMIAEALRGFAADLVVTLAIPGGEALARKTLNGRLGIVGGLSILGTTGIVIPYSCSAWIEAIRAGVEVALAGGLDHLVGCTGRTSEKAARRRLALPEAALIEMGDFAGGLFKVLKRRPVARLTLAGGFAKLAKLAQGELNLHSGASRVDLAALAGDLPALAEAGTAAGMLEAARALGLPLADRVAQGALAVARKHLPGHIRVDILVVDRKGEIVGHAG